MNLAVAMAARRRNAGATGDPAAQPTPEWRPFQLAFILLNIAGLADRKHADREIADLLFFPTGGGKTEAYLGLAAFVIAHRRLTGPGVLGAGVAVIMRYTLRLLTLDQLARAAGVVCALELMRTDPKNVDDKGRRHLGDWPIEIGLWVGSDASPNRLGGKGDADQTTAVGRVRRYKTGQDKRAPAPLKACPWCGTPFTPYSFACVPNDLAPTTWRSAAPTPPATSRAIVPLPILTVDEPIYRRLPAFLIATVDKFASLPWVGETGAFFGHVDRFAEGIGFYGANDAKARRSPPRQRLEARSARSDHPGRAASHRRPARHRRRPLRGRHRPACLARGRRQPHPAEDRGVDRDRPPRERADQRAVRSGRDHRCAAASRPASIARRARPLATPRGSISASLPRGADQARVPARAHDAGRRRAGGVDANAASSSPAESRRSLYDGALLLQCIARARRRAPDRRGRGARSRARYGTQRRRVDPKDSPFADRTIKEPMEITSRVRRCVGAGKAAADLRHRCSGEAHPSILTSLLGSTKHNLSRLARSVMIGSIRTCCSLMVVMGSRMLAPLPDLVAIDGKTSRRSRDRAATRGLASGSRSPSHKPAVLARKRSTSNRTSSPPFQPFWTGSTSMAQLLSIDAVGGIRASPRLLDAEADDLLAVTAQPSLDVGVGSHFDPVPAGDVDAPSLIGRREGAEEPARDPRRSARCHRRARPRRGSRRQGGAQDVGGRTSGCLDRDCGRAGRGRQRVRICGEEKSDTGCCTCRSPPRSPT